MDRLATENICAPVQQSEHVLQSDQQFGDANFKSQQTIWRIMFHDLFVDAECTDDLLFLVSNAKVAVTRRVAHIQIQSNPDWKNSFFLTLAAQTPAILTVSVCHKNQKKMVAIHRTAAAVYASPYV